MEKIVRTARLSLMAAATIAATVSLVSPGFATQPFDGSWDVTVVAFTPSPLCRVRSVSLRVEEGNIEYDGLLSSIASGKVDSRGRLIAQVAKASVSGNLVNDSGSGGWHSPHCVGSWTARRE